VSERITAKEAAARAKATREVNPQTVSAVLDCWLSAIRAAAGRGQTRIGEDALPVLRTPVSAAEYAAVRAELTGLGYTLWAGQIIWEEVA
jgi:hypothetical protein